ncbi:protein FAF-like, chloroplastic [Musa acuminata AAA Group]|uniref:protein FAF-like, chloroplastic n=1 Tax=Musa acuminata AAA Group TaxID=214697 RepID=UPI0031D3F901
MSVAVIQSSPASFNLGHRNWLSPADRYRSEEDRPPALKEGGEEPPSQFDIWSAIQSQKTAAAAADQPATPYVHPLVRRSSSSLSQKSLEICTESLGSETGSDDFFSFMDDLPLLDDKEKEEETKYVHEKQDAAAEAGEVIAAERGERSPRGKELTSVNYHCSISRRSPPRSFPPPLPSISRRDGPCFHMRPHRCDGRLVVEAVPVPPQNYLHARRVDGRLVLSFIDTIYGDEPGYESDASDAAAEITQTLTEEDVEKEKEEATESESMGITQLGVKEEEEEEEEEEELEGNNRYGGEEEELEENNCYEEEEVEVVDRGTVVEVKVSTQPQQQSGAMKVHRSSLVINKFVGDMPLSGMAEHEPSAQEEDNTSSQNKHNHTVSSAPAARRASSITTTAAAAVVAASTLGVSTESHHDHGYARTWTAVGGHRPPLDNKLLFTSKRRNREELLHNMRRCSQLRRPLFIWEPYCIATSS